MESIQMVAPHRQHDCSFPPLILDGFRKREVYADQLTLDLAQLLLYSIVGLIALLLVWFNALENSDILRVGNRTPLAST
jgi:hypothetical protein